MIKRIKIKAFTLIDVLVSLVITSIVITGAYYYLNYLQQGQSYFESNSSNNYLLKKTHSRLNSLFFLSRKIERKGDLIIFDLDSNIITAEVNNSEIILKDGVEYSLKWKLEDFTSSSTQNNQHIKSINIFFEFEDEHFEWYFYKQYGVLDLVKKR
jgi:competence protein ComGF